MKHYILTEVRQNMVLEIEAETEEQAMNTVFHQGHMPMRSLDEEETPAYIEWRDMNIQMMRHATQFQSYMNFKKSEGGHNEIQTQDDATQSQTNEESTVLHGN